MNKIKTGEKFTVKHPIDKKTINTLKRHQEAIKKGIPKDILLGKKG